MPTTEKIIRNHAKSLQQQLINWRRHIHQHPELSFEEYDTAQFVIDTLSAIPGMQVESGVGHETSVIGTLGGKEGPVAALRADMDALPIEEQNDSGYRSNNPGVMHACGHDAHTAIGLGAATILGDLHQKGQLEGTVKFLFQPAEEHADEHGLTGSQYMIDAGALEGIDGIFALHMNPENPFGEVKIHDGFSMANVDVFSASIEASGGHGAYPHLAGDTIWMLNQLLTALYALTGRRTSPLDPAVLSVGKIESGTQNNVIPSRVDIEGTIRTYEPDVQTAIHEEVRRAFGVVEALGGTSHLSIRSEDPALKNDGSINEVLRGTFTDMYPDFIQVDEAFGLGGEDFANMTHAVPGAMFFLGCREQGNNIYSLHSPDFDIDERVLSVGASIMAGAVSRFLRTTPEAQRDRKA